MATLPPLNNAARAQRNLRLQELAGKGTRYLAISDQIKPLEAEKKKLSGEIKEGVGMYGTKGEDGSTTLELPGIVLGVVVPKNETIDHAKALQILEELGLAERCTTRVVDQDALKIAFQEGLIDIDALNSFSTTTEGSPRVSVKKA